MTIKQCQHLLAYLGYYTGVVDGIWGPNSEDATRRFQADFDLIPDGVWGDQTDFRIREVIGTGEDLVLDLTESPGFGAADTNAGGKSEDWEDWWEEIEGFDPEEFRCTCGGRGCNGFPARPAERLVRNLAETRKNFGKLVPISSGVRCRLRNSELPGSAANSLHMDGKAADFCVIGQHSSVTLAYIRTLPNVDEAYAIDDSFVHMGVNKYN